MIDTFQCLMYHDVAATSELPAGGAAYFSVSRETFVRQLSLIEGLGYTGCSLENVLRKSGTPRVAISFDDGDLGQAIQAFPALVAKRMTATFFVTTSWVGRPAYASWDQLREMRDAGMSIQSHTHSHPFLSELSPDQVRDELRRARELLDERLEQRTTMLALPGGDAPRCFPDVLTEMGYEVLATSRWGTNHDIDCGVPRYIRRCTVRGDLSDQTFLAIATGNRWLSFKKRGREAALGFVRSSLGPTRYAHLRRRFLGGLSPRSDDA